MAYRAGETREPSESDRETDALRELLVSTIRLRARLVLPALVVSLVAVSIGTAAHALGYWSILGVSERGTYLIGAPTFFLAIILCSTPVVGPAVVVYLLARARLRRAWQERHRAKGVSAEWLAENVHRFS